MSQKTIFKKIKIFFVIICFALAEVPMANAGTLDSFARCLKDKGAIFYGAYWCPYCRAQKEMFGGSQKFLPYVECSDHSTKNERTVCNAKKILGFPTWEFSGSTRLMGEIDLETLAEKTGCELPRLG